MAEPRRCPDSPAREIPAGSWVEITQVVLRAGNRAPNVPADTAATDFVARIRGFLVESAPLGAHVTVRTLLGREVSGELAAVNPRNPADFGNPVPELLRLGLAARQALEKASSR
ncbi:MAG TPA: 2-amino-4-oxopentanoate thiolase subunit OrtA [Candidatus Limnocylindrales bacterium]